MRRRFAALLVAACVLAFGRSARAGDPYLDWYTLETPRFRVHYHSGLERVAQRVANLAEVIHARLSPQLDWTPTELTQIVVTDYTDAANGSATALPYNTIRLFVSSPDDMSVLGDYDDWLSMLLTHEHTHVLHADNTTGLPALVNAVLGKSFAPNQAQPRWILEGLAVAMESEHSSGGRVRSTQVDMFLRADLLANNLASLDQISHPARRWPGGNLWYLYGGHFIDWIQTVYGPDTFAAVASDYGQNPIPWGINRSIRRATGRTYPELFAGWQRHLRDKYTAQVAAVERRGLREGTRLTHRGQVVASPRFVPACARNSAREELLYYADDGHRTIGLYRVPLASRTRALEDETEIVTRTAGAVASFDPACNLIFTSVAPSRRRYYFNDLFRLPRGIRAPRGLDKDRQRLTIGRRARDPDVSPDGRAVVYVTNHAGTSTLRIAELGADGELGRERRLVPSAEYEQAYTPRFSPDGKRVAYSAWTRGGYRDIRVVDVASGRFIQLTHDRALDQQPAWARDGRTLYFASDRTGISNLYAYDFETATLHQVSNVVHGAYMPEPAPDGTTLFYVGYTHQGFDVFSLPVARARWLPAEDAAARPPAPPEPAARRFRARRYNPLTTLRPYAYELDYTTGAGTFGGDLFKISTTGSDAVGLHAFGASVTIDTEEPGEPAASLDYAYRQLPFDFHLGAFRSSAPRRGYVYGDVQPVVREYLTGVTTGVSFSMPGEFDFQSASLTYTVAEFNAHLPVGTRADPYSTVTIDPDQGFLGLLRLGYVYSNVEGTAFGISAEKGFALSLAADVADPAIGSDSTLSAFSGVLAGYLPMPWLRHHVLAAALSGGAAVGSFARRGLYATGGYVDGLPILDGFTSGLRQGAFVLRGYAPAQFIGSHYNLLNAEYRFPIAYVDRGVSTLPAFLRTVSGALFADYGGAYDVMDLDDPFSAYHLGVGGELWFEVVLGYHVGGTIRWGLARGIDDEAPGWQNYLVVSSQF
ncbi:MAG TPA: BamA/TamA family outer membrane protein [Polyangiaceae bacterium]